MLINTYHVLINAQVGTVWDLLMECFEKPQVHISGIESLRILERYEDGMIQELVWSGEIIRDKIRTDKNEARIIIDLIDHPIYTGRFITKLIPTAVQNPMAPVSLQVEANLERRSFKVERTLQTDAEMGKDIEKSLQQIKKMAEEREHTKEGRGQHLSEGVTHR